MNSNKIVLSVNSNKPANSKIVCLVNFIKPVRPGNSGKPVRPIDVCKSVCPVNSNKPVYPVDVYQSVRAVGVSKPVRPVDIRKDVLCRLLQACNSVFHFIYFFFFVVSVNTNVFSRIILYMIIFIKIHTKYSIFLYLIFKVHISYVDRLLFYSLQVDVLNIHF